MSKEETIKFQGVVIEVLPRGFFAVELDQQNHHKVTAYSAGRIRKNRISIIKGDKVTVEMSPYDLNTGRIVQIHREKFVKPSQAQKPRRH